MRVAQGRHSELALHTLRLVFVFLLVATAIPGAIGPARFQWRRWDGSDILANILLYVPLGVALRSRVSLLKTVTIAAAFSAAILAATGLLGFLQVHHPALRAALGGAAGFSIGHMMTPHNELYPLGPVMVGTAAGISLASCSVLQSQSHS